MAERARSAITARAKQNRLQLLQPPQPLQPLQSLLSLLPLPSHGLNLRFLSVPFASCLVSRPEVPDSPVEVEDRACIQLAVPCKTLDEG